ncbi:MAG: hypothetical protein ACFFCS_01450 [Candidatus Hodarchaeota archaeon]
MEIAFGECKKCTTAIIKQFTEPLTTQPFKVFNFEPLHYASQLNIHQSVITKAEQILINAQGKLNTAGKAPKGYIAASLYIACQQLGEHRSQKQIASVCNITEVTLRSRIKEFQKL